MSGRGVESLGLALEPISERHRGDVIDILNYYIAESTAAYREEPVGYGHFDKLFPGGDVISSYAAMQGDTAIGFCVLEYYKAISTFRGLGDAMYFIAPGHTGKGIGPLMLKALERDAYAKGIKKLVVDICDDNERSLEFHRRNGFVEYGRLSGCWEKFGKSLGIVFMEKALA